MGGTARIALTGVRLYAARWVVPVSAPPIADGVVAVAGGRIAWIGRRASAPAGELHELGNAVLVPGLVNVHSHLELTAMRGFLEGLTFRQWIVTLTAARRATQTREMLLDAARLGAAEGVRAGITCFADTCESGVAAQALAERGARGIMYQEVFGADPADREDALAGLRAKVDALRAVESALVRVGVSPHAPYSVADTLFAAVARYAIEARLPMAIHIAEGEEEFRLVAEGAGEWGDAHRARGIQVTPRGRTPVDMLERLGVLAARPLLIHCVRVDAKDIASIARASCPVAHCPASNAKFGHGVAPLRELLDAGIRVGLGSDSVASNNRMDLLEEARLALLLQNVRLARPDAMDAAAALRLATLGGAEALGLEHEIGSIEVGKSADLAAFTLDGRASSSADPAESIVLALGGRDALLAMVAGRALVRDGRLVETDSDLSRRVDAAAGALRAWRGSDARSR